MVSGNGSCGEEFEDPEYNYLADQLDEEKEEFRDDRAVRISSKLSYFFFFFLQR